MKTSHPRWKNLLAWLNTHGMDTDPEKMLVEVRPRRGGGYGLFALKSIDPGTPLFAIPASAMLNTLTLSSHYPRTRKLTAVQLISLHLLLYRPIGSQDSLDPLFGPYISVLPRKFDHHPLTWFCDKTGHNPGTRLLERLPASVTSGLLKLSDRFYADRKAVCQYLQENPSVWPKVGDTQIPVRNMEDPIFKTDYLWAWLNVNTRCIYHHLKLSPSDPDNLTLCPVLDFANHTTSNTHMILRHHLDGVKGAVGKKTGGDFILLSPSCAKTGLGDELYLTYGAHANTTLFIEYGFVNEVPEEVLSSESFQGEVDVQTLVEPLFEARGRLGKWMRETLEDEGYWGNWTLHAMPRPAHPSYRLITALRIYRLLPMSAIDVPPIPDEILQPWKDTVVGAQEKISDENEDAWRDVLVKICQELTEGAQSAIIHFEKHSQSERGGVGEMKESIKMLWKEEHYVARVVAASVLAGELF